MRVRVSTNYSERVSSLVADLAARYGNKPFSRDNIGAGALGRALFFGVIAYADGADSITSDAAGPVYHGRGARFRIVSKAKPHANAATVLASKR